MPELAEAHYRGDICEPAIHAETVTLDYHQLLRTRAILEGNLESEYWRLFELFSEAGTQIHALARLGPNWDSYGAEPPNETARNTAERVLGLLRRMSVPPARVVASAEGGVGICFVHEDRYADLECFNDGEIVAVSYRGTDEPDVWDVTPQDESIKAAIEKIRAHIRL